MADRTQIPRSVSVCEVVLRDGFQGWPDFIPTTGKVAMVHAIARAGFRELDVTSFVPRAAVPQFADAAEVLAAVPEQLTTRVLTPNLKGVERVISVSRRTHAQHREQLLPMIAQLLEAGVAPLVAVATAYGCPIAGRVEQDQVFEITGWLHDQGVRRLMFGDTTGMADPARAHALFSAARLQWPDAEFVAHFHDNRGVGIANTLAALDAGANSVDSSLGGLGGEPSAVDQGDVGESGNVATEDLVAVLARLGIETGLDEELVLEAGAALEAVVGRRLHSRVLRAGLISDEPRREVS